MNAAIASLFLAFCPMDEPIRVTVVVVLASTRDTGVDKRLTELAREVQKRDSTLVGFKLAATEAKSIPVGDGHCFDLVENEVMKVRVEKSKDANGRVSITIKPPGLEKITYDCTCGKFFPVVTPHTTKNGEILIIAIMAKPCMAGKKEKSAGWFPWPDS
jgi:hypothetical protein